MMTSPFAFAQGGPAATFGQQFPPPANPGTYFNAPGLATGPRPAQAPGMMSALQQPGVLNFLQHGGTPPSVPGLQFSGPGQAPSAPGLGGAIMSMLPQVAAHPMVPPVSPFAAPQMQSAPMPAPQPGMGMASPFQGLMQQFGPTGGASPSMPGNVGAFMGGANRWAPFGSMGAFG